MKFLCLACEQEETFHEMPLAEWQDLREEVLNYVDSLTRSGHLLAAHALQSARLASTVRVRDGKVALTDGPFAETKEHIGGFFLIEAADFDEAVRIAAGWPSARLGSIEVRPIEEELPQDTRYVTPE